MKYLLLVLVAYQAFAGNAYHVTTTGGGAGEDGSSDHPWRLSYGLGDSADAIAGDDTLWIHGGTYAGNFVCKLAGTNGHPVIVRNYNGERVILNGGSSPVTYAFTFAAASSYCWLWGVEIMSECTDRSSTVGPPSYSDTDIPSGIAGDGLGAHSGLRVINCVLHDVFIGVNWFHNEQDGELYGNIFYNIGSARPNGTPLGTGYAIYAHTGDGGKTLLSNNIAGNSYGYNFHIYTESEKTDSITVRRNILYDAFHLIGDDYDQSGYMMGLASAETQYSDTLDENYFWSSNGSAHITVGYYLTITQNGAITNNRIFGANTAIGMTLNGGDSNLTITGNTIVANWDTWAEPVAGRHILLHDGYTGNAKYADNTFLKTYIGDHPEITNPLPTVGDSTYYLPNAYETKRGHVVSYNWDAGATVSVKLTSGFAAGDSVFIYNASNLFGDSPDTVVLGADSVLSIPMDSVSWSMAVPSGASTPSTHHPAFGVFLLTGARLAGSASDTAASVTASPSNGTAVKGSTHTFTVTASGNPNPTYQWQKGSVNISGATSASYTTPAVTPADNGNQYRCIVTNSAGSDTSDAATLTVTCPKKWIRK